MRPAESAGADPAAAPTVVFCCACPVALLLLLRLYSYTVSIIVIIMPRSSTSLKLKAKMPPPHATDIEAIVSAIKELQSSDVYHDWLEDTILRDYLLDRAVKSDEDWVDRLTQISRISARVDVEGMHNQLFVSIVRQLIRLSGRRRRSVVPCSASRRSCHPRPCRLAYHSPKGSEFCLGHTGSLQELRDQGILLHPDNKTKI